MEMTYSTPATVVYVQTVPNAEADVYLSWKNPGGVEIRVRIDRASFVMDES